MAHPKFFNKGTLRGTVAKAELVKYGGGTTGKKEGELFVIEVNTGGNNKVSSTFFNTKKNPGKCKELESEWKPNSKVEISGNITERENTTQAGKKYIERGVNGFMIKAMGGGAKEGAFFIFQGTVLKKKETEDGMDVVVEYEEEYEPEGKPKEIRKSTITLSGDKAAIEVADDVDLGVGCNAKFKGQIVNKLEVDDYGDVTGRTQMYLIEKIEDVIQKDDITKPEEPDFM